MNAHLSMGFGTAKTRFISTKLSPSPLGWSSKRRTGSVHEQFKTVQRFFFSRGSRHFTNSASMPQKPRWDQTSGRHWQAAVASLCCFSNADFSGASRAMAMGSPLAGETARSPKSEPKPQLTPRRRKESKPILINTRQSRKAHTKVLHLPHVVLHPSRDITGRSKKSLGITNSQAFSFQGCF